jgi:hypothetical protein
MATKWCPACGAEYVEGIERCADCGVVLVEEMPEPAQQARGGRGGSPRPDDPHDDLVEAARVPFGRGGLVVAALQSAGIAAFEFDNATFAHPVAIVQGSRIMVRRDDLAAAEGIVADVFSEAAMTPLSDAELAAQAEAAAGYSDPETGAIV